MDKNNGKKVGISTYVGIAVVVALTQLLNFSEILLITFTFALAGGFVWMINKFGSKKFEPFAFPFSLLASMFLIGVASSLYAGIIAVTWLDYLILGIGLLWLYAKPGTGPIILLSVKFIADFLFQLFMILSGAPITGGAIAFEISFILIKFGAIYLMIKGLSDYKKLKDVEDTAIILNDEAAELSD